MVIIEYEKIPKIHVCVLFYHHTTGLDHKTTAVLWSLCPYFSTMVLTKTQSLNPAHEQLNKVIGSSVTGQIGHCKGGNFLNIHICAWSASPSAQVGNYRNKSNAVSLECCHIFAIRDQLPVFCPIL